MERSDQLINMLYFGEPWPLDMLENIPHLHPLATSIRDTLGFKDKTLRDKTLQNRLNYENFMAWINKSIFNRIKITHEYYLLAALFKDPSKQAKWLDFLDRMYAEKQKNFLEQEQNYKLMKTGFAATSAQSFQNQKSLFLIHPDSNLSNMEKWNHYIGEHKRITIDLHQQKIQAYRDSLNQDIARADQVLEQLDKESAEYREIKSIRDDCIRKRDEISSRNVLNSTGHYDEVALVQQEKEFHLMKQEYHERFCKAYGFKPGNKHLKAAYQKQQEEKSILETKIDQLDNEFKEIDAELSKKIQEFSVASKKEIDDQVKKITRVINTTDFNELSDSQKMDLAQLQHYLNKCQEQLSTIENPEQYQKAVTQMSLTIQNHASTLPHPLKDKIIPIAEQLGRTNSTLEFFKTQLSQENNLNQDKMPEMKQNTLVKNSLFTTQRNYKAQLNEFRKTDNHSVNGLYKEIVTQITLSKKKHALSEKDKFQLNEIEVLASNNSENCLNELYQKISEASEILSNSDELLEKIESIQENKGATPST